MPLVVAVVRDGPTAVRDLLNSVVRIVSPDRVAVRALLRDMPRFQPAIAIVGQGRVLVRATAFRASILPDLRHLSASVVTVDCCRVDTASLPIENLCLYSTTQHIRVDLLLAALCDTAINGSFICQSHHFTASAATAGVTGFCRCAIGIGGD